MLHDVTIARREVRALIELRGDADAAARVAPAAGVVLPARPNRVAHGADGACSAWLGPRRWLVMAPIAREDQLCEAIARAARLEPLLDWAAVSDMHAVLTIAGPGVVDVLAQGCALDLEGDAFAVDTMTGTEMWGVGVLLRRAADGFEILVDRSLAGFLENWLVTAAGGRSGLRHAATQFVKG